MRLIAIIVFLTSLAGGAAAQETERAVDRVPVGGRLVLDLDEDRFTRALGSGDERAVIERRPTLGNAFVDEDGRIIYFADARESGLDRMTVSRDGVEAAVTMDIVVGEPNIAATDIVYERLGELLFTLLIIAIFLEIALTFVFKTRFWLTTLEHRTGLKTAVGFAVSLAVAVFFDLNIFGEVIEAVQRRTYSDAIPRMLSYGVTALLLAGGSGTIYKLYQALNIRPPTDGAGVSGAALKGRGYLRIKVTRASASATEPIQVVLDDEMIGQIPGGEVDFPPADHLPVKAGAYTLTLASNDANGAKVEKAVSVGLRPDAKDAAIPVKL